MTYSLKLVGLTRVELVTSSLSGTRSNQLSYKPGGFGREAEHFVVVYVGFNSACPEGRARPADRSAFSLERR